MSHIKQKASSEIKINFNPNDLSKIIPSSAQKATADFYKEKTVNDQYDYLTFLEDKAVYSFEYVHSNKKEKSSIIELNPVTIFFSNAVMSCGILARYKNKLLQESITSEGKTITVNLSHSAAYYQLVINCIINLQATLESFANRIIPADYLYLSKSGNPVPATVGLKVFVVVPKLKLKSFSLKKNAKHNKKIEELISLRNKIVHLKPTTGTNTGYKNLYRELLDFDYRKTLEAVKTYINFFEDGLIEECSCGKDYCYIQISMDEIID